MAYHHYTPGVQTHDDGFGTDIAPAAPPQGFTTDPNAYTTPAGANNAAMTPGPTDLMPPSASKPADAPFMPAAPPTPIVPLTPMAQQGFFDSIKSKLTQPGGPFGVAWRWWILGGAAVLVYRSQSGESVTPNSRRKKRSRR